MTCTARIRLFERVTARWVSSLLPIAPRSWFSSDGGKHHCKAAEVLQAEKIYMRMFKTYYWDCHSFITSYPDYSYSYIIFTYVNTPKRQVIEYIIFMFLCYFNFFLYDISYLILLRRLTLQHKAVFKGPSEKNIITICDNNKNSKLD